MTSVGGRRMSGLTPIYTADNVKIAYQLNWSLTVFWHDAPFSDDWLPALRQVTEADGVRILEHRFVTPTCSLFLISTRPELLAREIPRSVKGRLQYLVRDRWPKAFQRNYDLRSIGSTAGWPRRCFERLGCATTRGNGGRLTLSIPLVPSSDRRPKRRLGHPVNMEIQLTLISAVFAKLSGMARRPAMPEFGWK